MEEVAQAMVKEPHQVMSHLVSVLLKQGQDELALDYLLVARMQAVPFSEQNTLLLAGLYAANGNPYAGAKTLQEALASGVVIPVGEHYRTLFEYWLQAQERERATKALAQAARLTADGELYLYWAHLLLEQTRWTEMNAVVHELCEADVDPRLTVRANWKPTRMQNDFLDLVRAEFKSR